MIFNALQNKSGEISKNMYKIIEIAKDHEHEIDFRSLYESLFNLEDIPPFVKIQINKYANNHKNCLSPSMNFIGMIFDCLASVKKFSSMVA